MTRVNIAQADITLMLDNDGVIRNASLANSMAGEGVGAWLGRPWADTVGEVGTDGVRRMLDDARRNGVSAFRQVTQRFPSGLELPIEYTTVRLGVGAGLIAVGKNLQAVADLQSQLTAAQQARERDHWKLREIETRARLLLDAAGEAVLLLRADTLRIVEANLAAVRQLGVACGGAFLEEVSPRDQDALRGLLLRAREHGRVPGVLIRLGEGHTSWMVRASTMATEAGLLYMLQLERIGEPLAVRSSGSSISTGELLERLPDAFLVMDRYEVVRRANRAFLALAQTDKASAIGECLGRWLRQPGATAAVLFSQCQQHGSVRLFAARLTGDLGVEADVEISASRIAQGGSALVAMVLRDISRRMPVPDVNDQLRGTVAAAAERIGKTALPAIVRDIAEVVERHCVETALRLAGGNRTAAAETLGLSRQSLYSKLHRYRITGTPGGAWEALK